MLLNGAHAILYSAKAEADRAFLRDVLKLPHVDAGEGWLIFGLPPAEIAIHPGENDVQELYLMSSDIQGFVAEMKKNKIKCTEVADRGWGLVTQLTLPGGSKLGVYEPRHARPKSPAATPRREDGAQKLVRRKGSGKPK
jgi:hypothetical protein